MKRLFKQPIDLFWPYLRPYKKEVVWGMVLIAAAQAVSTTIPLFFRKVVDDVHAWVEGEAAAPRWADSIQGDILVYVGMIGTLALIQMGFQMGMRWLLNSAARRAENDIRQDYFYHLLTLPISYYHKTPTGDLMSRATNDLNAVRMFLGFGLRMLFDAVLAFALGLIVMCYLDWKLAIYALLPMPVLALVMNRVASSIHANFREVQEGFSRISARVQENISGIRAVKAYVQREPEIADFDVLNDDFLEKNKKLVRVEALFRPLSFLISGSSLLIILWVGGGQVVRSELSLGDFVAFNAYLTKLIFPMILLGWMIDRYQRGLASMQRIREVIETRPNIVDGDTVSVESLRGDVEFRNLSFSYDGTPVLRNISVRVPAGSSLAIVGRVGSGKTTLGRLIPRLIEPQEGEVCIDGHRVDRIPIAQLRKAIGYVPQEPFLFSDTLYDNIAYGIDEDQDEEQVVTWAAEVSQLANDLEDIPDGLQARVGERGVTLSGGQKQRASLARAVARKPRILILDDAMAAVDTHTEEEILRRLRTVMEGRTTILISHRVSTVQHADRIIVLEEGAIVEQGTHAELVALGGRYADMHRRQQLTEELDEI